MLARITSISTLASTLILAGSASAAITSTAGQALQIGPPANSGSGFLTGMTAFAWDEQTAVAFTGPADMTNNPANNGTAIPGVISGLYDSHFIHFEGIPGIIGVQGSVTFSAPIVAVMFNQPNLDNSDAPFGAFGTIYPTTDPLRGISAASIFSIAGNTLNFQLISTVAVGDFEQIRVLTHAVPAPGIVATLSIAGGIAATRRRR